MSDTHIEGLDKQESGEKPLDLVVLAGGRGARFGGPKQFASIGSNGETLLEYSVFDALRAGFSRIVLVIQHSNSADQISDLMVRLNRQIEIVCVYQDDYAKAHDVPRDKPWGTAHAILCASLNTEHSFAVINADDYCGRETLDRIARFLTSEYRNQGMVGFPIENTLSEYGDVSRGICSVDKRGNLINIEEHLVHKENDNIVAQRRSDGHKELVPKGTLTSMNVWGFQNTISTILQESWSAFIRDNEQSEDSELYITTVINNAIENGRITCEVLQTKNKWFGVTYRNDLDKVCREISKLHNDGYYPMPLFG
jgi:CTP:molybdopterin cytidylyltransferase MocA